MRNLFLLTMTFIGFTAFVGAQDISENALGLRLGDSDGFGAEVSYQRALGDSNRLEFDLGWRSGNNYDGFKLAALYQWVWYLDGGFNRYAGVGGGIASFSGTNSLQGTDGTSVFAAGDIGIEYNFDIPLQLSLDFRPEIGNSDFTDNTVFDIALGIRYQF